MSGLALAHRRLREHEREAAGWLSARPPRSLERAQRMIHRHPLVRREAEHMLSWVDCTAHHLGERKISIDIKGPI